MKADEFKYLGLVVQRKVKKRVQIGSRQASGAICDRA